MSEIQIIPNNDQILDEARSEAKKVLAQSDVFKAMSLSEQKDIYKSLVDEYVDKKQQQYGVSKSMATDKGADMGHKGYDAAYGSEVKAFTGFVESVDFPQFVSDLLNGVFEANLDVMNKQTKSYIELMKLASKSTSDFIKNVKDDDAFGKVLEKYPNKYNTSKESVTNKDGSKSEKMTIVDASNEKVDIENAEVKKHLLEAKIEMAKEHRAALREILLMGVTRLVVEKGEIDAQVEFSIKATRSSTSHHDDNTTTVRNTEGEIGGSYGPFGIMKLPASGTYQENKSEIVINTADKVITGEMGATLKGHVNIKFKTDYFKLDNFANMYADGGTAALKPAPQGQGQLPPQR